MKPILFLLAILLTACHATNTTDPHTSIHEGDLIGTSKWTWVKTLDGKPCGLDQSCQISVLSVQGDTVFAIYRYTRSESTIGPECDVDTRIVFPKDLVNIVPLHQD